MYHPQTNGQTKVVNGSLEIFLRCLVGDHLSAWDQVQHLTEFAYNHFDNCSTRLSPFEAVLGFQPYKPIDLIPLPPETRPDELVKSFAQYIHNLHAEIYRKITLSNANYKYYADLHRRF